MTSPTWLDRKITTTFRLFTGQRSQAEDRRIYNRICNLLLDELIAFADTHLTLAQKNHLSRQLESASPAAATSILSAVTFYSPLIASQLKHRLDYFLDSLLVTALKKKPAYG